MFERRLRWFMVALALLAVITIGRLADIQVVRAAELRDLADKQLTRPLTYLRAPRGAIYDRHGRRLVADIPAHDVAIHYAILAGDSRDYLPRVARELRRRGEFPSDMPISAIVDQLMAEIGGIWRGLARISGESMDELLARADRIQRRVEAIKRIVRRHNPTVRLIAEENMLHPILEGVSDDVAFDVRLELDRYPWLKYPLVRVSPATTRVGFDVDPLSHVIGQVGEASPRRIERDPLADDPLRGLRAGDSCGVSGIERVAELALRGTRGYIEEDFDHSVIRQVAPQPGGDVYLTIDADLQQKAYEIVAQELAARAEAGEAVSGAAAVVIDAQTRDVLALVSYPSYPYADYRKIYNELRADDQHTPLRFRAVANGYEPGSTCKAIALYGALVDGVISPNSTINCSGMFSPDMPNRFRCWIYNQYGVTHGAQTPTEAIRNSCNIFFYHAGRELGVERLTYWFRQFGMGRAAGTGLIEESRGNVPTVAELQQVDRQRNLLSDAMNFAIGQGEIQATPLQAANVAATIATGEWTPVVLLRDASGRPLSDVSASSDFAPHFDPASMKVIRTGMWRVVNEHGATAHGAKLNSEQYELCGKTGSAQTMSQPLEYLWTFEHADGGREEVIAPAHETETEVLARFPDPKPKWVGKHTHKRFPDWQPGDKLPAHAWFIGFTQDESTPRGAAPRGQTYAIAAIVEYGESGGRVAGPIVRQIAEYLVSDESRAVGAAW